MQLISGWVVASLTHANHLIGTHNSVLPDPFQVGTVPQNVSDPVGTVAQTAEIFKLVVVSYVPDFLTTWGYPVGAQGGLMMTFLQSPPAFKFGVIKLGLE
jgi:hypothetical protein